MTDSASDARLYAVKLLGYKGRSEKELRERLLRKGFRQDIVDDTLLHLKEAGLIDDRALASNLKRQALEVKLLGYEGARAFMLRRGLPTSVIEWALTYDEDSELENAVKFLDMKMPSLEAYPAEGKKRKLWNLLARRGYSSWVIRKAMRDFTFDEEV